MSSPVMTLCNLIEDIKTKITDAQYMEMLDQLRIIHNEHNDHDFRLPTPEKVKRLAYSIVRSGVKNPGQLAYILSKKGYTYDEYMYESFKEWMQDIGVTLRNNQVEI